MPVNVDATLAGLESLKGRIELACQKSAMQVSLAIQAAGMEKTRVASGALRRSWHTKPEISEGIYGAKVGPTMVYARRQELGFVGADSLGRIYDEPATPEPGPYGSKRRRNPYVRPAALEALPRARGIIQRVFTKALS